MGRTSEYDKTGAGLLRVNGEDLDSMMAVGKSPWHYATNESMVNLLAKGAKITSKEVNKAAGLDWTVSQVELSDILKDGYRALPGDIANFRDDLKLKIGNVKKRYRVFQNSEAPTFLDNLVDTGDAEYVTAGSLHGGAVVWWLMKLPQGVTVGGDPREKLETYILFMNSHDGSTSVSVSIVTVRVVCQNTLAWALRSALRQIKIKHTESAKEKWAQARTSLELGYTYQSELAEYGDKMLDVSFTDDELNAFLDELVPTPEPEYGKNKKDETVIKNQRGITMAINTKGGIKSLYYNQDPRVGQAHVEGTLWGAVQAVSYYSDHLSISRDTSANGGVPPEENRFKRLTSGDTLSAKAFEKALVLV